MTFSTEYPDADYLLTEFFDSAGDIKKALADGHLSVDEIVNAIPDPGIKEGVRRNLTALKGLPAEMSQIAKNPWKMAMEFVPMLVTRVMAIFK